MAITLTYDAEADVLALGVRPSTAKSRSREVAPGIYLELDERGRMVRLEVISASAHAPKAALVAVAPARDELTLTEAAREYDRAASTLRVQIRNQRLRARKVGRDWVVSRADMESYMDAVEQAQPAAAPRAPAKAPARRGRR